MEVTVSVVSILSTHLIRIIDILKKLKKRTQGSSAAWRERQRNAYSFECHANVLICDGIMRKYTSITLRTMCTSMKEFTREVSMKERTIIILLTISFVQNVISAYFVPFGQFIIMTELTIITLEREASMNETSCFNG